jgi:hypothetical protein
VSTKPGSASVPPAIEQHPETRRPEASAPRDEPISNPIPARPIERLFPFVLRAGILLIGREKLRHNKGRLHFVLITDDIAESHRSEILLDFKHYPVVQHFVAADLEKFFKIKGAKAIGFAKSGLAQSIYAELKEYRINRPVEPRKPSELPPTTTGTPSTRNPATK